jgi:hypothetical protein
LHDRVGSSGDDNELVVFVGGRNGRPARRRAATPRSWYSVDQRTIALVATVRHHIGSGCCPCRRRSAPSPADARERRRACRETADRAGPQPARRCTLCHLCDAPGLVAGAGCLVRRRGVLLRRSSWARGRSSRRESTWCGLPPSRRRTWRRGVGGLGAGVYLGRCPLGQGAVPFGRADSACRLTSAAGASTADVTPGQGKAWA